MPIELKPCPFCGGINVGVLQSYCSLNGHKYWYIAHLMPTKECPLTDCFNRWHSSEKYTTKEKAIEAWNRRADDGA